MGRGTLRMHRTGNTKGRFVGSTDAALRSTMGKTGKGRSRKAQESRQEIRHGLRTGDFA